MNLPKPLTILKSLFVTTLLYTLVVLVWPLFWATYYSPTSPPINPGIIYHNSQYPSQKSIYRAVVIGDSTALGQGTDSVEKSFGYQYLLTRQDLKDQNWSFENRAISGVKIAEVLERQLDFEPVDLVMISVGANDITGNTNPVEFRSSIEKLANKLQIKAKQVIWLNIPDFVTSPILLPPLNYILSRSEHEPNEIIKNAANQAGYQIVDVYNGAREPFAKYPEKYFGADKYHPSAAGYAVWAQIINQNINK
jgi:lysophospholipase L1-like esterase